MNRRSLFLTPLAIGRGELKPFYNTGLIELRQGNYEVSRDYLSKTLDIAREIGDQMLAAEA